MIYALLGIPLFGFLLAGVGDQLGTIFGKSISKVEKMIEVSTLSVSCIFFTFIHVRFVCLFGFFPPYNIGTNDWMPNLIHLETLNVTQSW